MTTQLENKIKETAPEIAVTGEKLDLRKKMGTITMVTPPSFFQNQNKSFCLINLSKKDKDNFADQINKYFPKDDLTIYLWDDNNFSALDPFGGDDPEYEKYLENWKPNKQGQRLHLVAERLQGRNHSDTEHGLQFQPDEGVVGLHTDHGQDLVPQLQHG
jgi:hypothetical protein